MCYITIQTLGPQNSGIRMLLPQDLPHISEFRLSYVVTSGFRHLSWYLRIQALVPRNSDIHMLLSKNSDTADSEFRHWYLGIQTFRHCYLRIQTFTYGHLRIQTLLPQNSDILGDIGRLQKLALFLRLSVPYFKVSYVFSRCLFLMYRSLFHIYRSLLGDCKSSRCF